MLSSLFSILEVWFLNNDNTNISFIIKWSHSIFVYVSLSVKVVEIYSHLCFPPCFECRKYDYDTLKIEHHAHGAKSNDPVINKHDDNKLIIKPDLPLRYNKFFYVYIMIG